MSKNNWNTCSKCNGRIERLGENTKNPYWAHMDAYDKDNYAPHAAVPKK